MLQNVFRDLLVLKLIENILEVDSKENQYKSLYYKF